MSLAVGWFFLSDENPGEVLPAAGCLDVAGLGAATRSPTCLIRPYEFKERPEPAIYTQKIITLAASFPHHVYQLACESNMESERFRGGPADYAAWVEDVRDRLPDDLQVGVGAFSPGDAIVGVRTYADTDGWDALAPMLDADPDLVAVLHVYAPSLEGLKASYRRQVERLPDHTRVIVGETNFGPGPAVQIDRDGWGLFVLRPFLEWLATDEPRCEMLLYFARTWPTPEPWFAGGTPVDGAGTGVERVLRAWVAPAGPIQGSSVDASAVVLPPQPTLPTKPSLETPMVKRCYLWQFDQLGETSVAEIAATLRLGGVTEVACKTHQELTWIGNATTGDTSPLAFRSLADVRQRFEQFRAEGIRMVPWCVPMGLDLEAEAQRAYEVAEACDGVIELDVEPYEGFWEGDRLGLAPFCHRLADLGADYELNMDLRLGGWQPFGVRQLTEAAAGATAFWSQTYWRWFQQQGDQRSTREIVREAIETLRQFEVPPERQGIIFPSQAPDEYATVAEQIAAAGIGRVGMWRMGDAGLPVYRALAAIPTAELGEPDAVTAATDGLWALTERLAAIDHREMAVAFQRKIVDLKVALGREG